MSQIAGQFRLIINQLLLQTFFRLAILSKVHLLLLLLILILGNLKVSAPVSRN